MISTLQPLRSRGGFAYTLWLVRRVPPYSSEGFLLSRQQRLTTWMAAITVMIGSLGVPLSSQRAPRSGAAFPCQDCVCGCPDAETCWRDCCCFTNAQKIVWAEKNGVKVPLYVTVAARREQTSAAKPSCCRDHDAGGKCESQLCTDGSVEPCTSPSCCEKKAPKSSESAGKTVLLITALKCRGISVSIGWLPPSLPPLQVSQEAAADFGPLLTESVSLYAPPSFDVATPPPDARELLAS
jgi:hypothetical protein